MQRALIYLLGLRNVAAAPVQSRQVCQGLRKRVRIGAAFGLQPAEPALEFRVVLRCLLRPCQWPGGDDAGICPGLAQAYEILPVWGRFSRPGELGQQQAAAQETSGLRQQHALLPIVL